MKKLSIQFMRYFWAAAIGYVVDFGTLLICKEILGLHYLIGSSAGFILGLITVYAISSYYVFGDSKIASIKYEFVAFAVIGLIGLGILNVLMWTLTDGAHINYLISKILATVVVYLWNFFARRALYNN